MLRKNNGIFDYGKSKRKEFSDTLTASEKELFAADDAPSAESYHSLQAGMNKLSADIERSQTALDALADKALREEYYRNKQRDFFVSKDTEERRRRQFAMSPRAVNDAVEEYYDSTMRGEFEKQRAAAEAAGYDEYQKYASTPGANPLTAMGAMQRAADPAKVIDRTMQASDGGALDKISDAYARYAGFDPKSYREAVLEPALREKMVDEYVDDSRPKSSMEYIFRGARNNSLTGKMVDWSQGIYSGTDSYRKINDAALEKYGGNRVENFAAGVGSLLTDGLVFYGLGSGASGIVGGTTSIVKNRLAKNILAKGASSGVNGEIARTMAGNIIKNNIASKIVRSSATQALTLGGYDAANSVFDDLVHGENVDTRKAADAFGRGAGTGTLLGVVGTPLRAASKGLTGGKKIAASAGVLSAESAVFTLGHEFEKAANGADIEPLDLLVDFGESAATLLAMRMFHWRPSGASEKLNSVGRLKQGLRFSYPEAREIESAGVNPQKFVDSLERTLNGDSRNMARDTESVKADYLRLMANSELSASTRAKLLFIVENKLTSTPPVAVDYKIEALPDGRFTATTYNINGGKIESTVYDSRGDLDGFIVKMKTDLRKNRIAGYEKILTQSYDSQNFFRQAGEYARETGTSVEDISDIMYRKANKEPLNATEQQMMDEIFRRSGYNDSEIGGILYDIRRNLEQEYGLRDGSLITVIDKPFYRCSPKENAALDAYEDAVYRQVERLRANGRAASVAGSSSSDAPSNEELKSYERGVYMDDLRRNGNRALNEGAAPDFMSDIMPADIANSPSEPIRDYNFNAHKHSAEKLQTMADEAMRLGRELGVDLKIVYDNREIPRENNSEYANQSRALGWYDSFNDKVTINLSNNADVSEVKRTVVHEVVGHRGFQRLFGEYYINFLEEVYDRGSADVKSAIKQIQRKYNNCSSYEAVDEYLAHLAERTENSAEQRSLLRRFKDFVREMLRRFKIVDGEISEGELVELIGRHHNAIRKNLAPEEYRKQAFGGFESARHKNSDYSDFEKYKEWSRERYESDPSLSRLPEFFHKERRDLYNNHHYRFIGEQGTGNLAKNNNHILNNKLEQAKSMQQSGLSPRFIKLKTGWETGADGKWRFEIPEDFEINDYVYESLIFDENRLYAKKYRQIQSIPPEERSDAQKKFLNSVAEVTTMLDDKAELQDIVNDRFLFAAYPELRNVPVRFYPLDGRLCVYNPHAKVLYIDKKAFADPDFKRKLVMPMQRMIQDYEDFSRAFNIDAVADASTRKRYDNALKAAELLKSMENSPGFDDKFADEKNFFIRKFGLSYNDFLTRYPTLNEYLLNIKNGRNLSQQGDVELRNVERRFNMPMHRRKFITGEYTEDFPRERQIESRRLDFVTRFLGGPLDLIRRRLRTIDSDAPQQFNGSDSPEDYRSYKQRMDDADFLNRLEGKMLYEYYKNQNKGKSKDVKKRLIIKDKDKGHGGNNSAAPAFAE